MTLPPVLTLSFWFNPNPPAFVPVMDRIILVLMAAFVVVGIAAYVYRAKGGADKLMRQAVAKAGSLFITAGLIGLLLYAFQYESVTYFSMRIWWLPLAIWFVWRAWTVYKFAFNTIPALKEKYDERAKFEKWLPKKKK